MSQHNAPRPVVNKNWTLFKLFPYKNSRSILNNQSALKMPPGNSTLSDGHQSTCYWGRSLLLSPQKEN